LVEPVGRGERSHLGARDRPSREHGIADALLELGKVEPALVRDVVPAERAGKPLGLVVAVARREHLLEAPHVGVDAPHRLLDRRLARLPRAEPPPQIPRGDAQALVRHSGHTIAVTLDVNLLDGSWYAGDPSPTYARLRAEAPVYYDAVNELWGISRHADIV